MAKEELIEIADLQPTQAKVGLLTIAYYNNPEPKEQSPLPEVWRIDGQIYISEGHHDIFDQYLRKQTKTPVLMHSPETCKVSKQAYECFTEKLLRRGKRLVRAGITHIKDLKLS